MIVQASEFEEPFTISSITFFPVPGTGEETIFYQLSIDLGYCTSAELESVYEGNYLSGTKTRVFERNSSFTVSSHSPTLYFDSPFVYNPAEGNLIIDMVWPDGEGEFYTYNFPTPGASAISGAYDIPEGYVLTDMSHLLIQGELSMEQSTFAGIKGSFF